MVALAKKLGGFTGARVLVLGDLMLDTYTIGQVERISAEAPVSILKVVRQEERAGGAGNVALNIAALGAKVILLGRIGSDPASEALVRVFQQEGIDPSYLLVQESFCLPIKNRVVADNQQMIRIDHEEKLNLSVKLEEALIEQFTALISEVDIVALSDYAKGLFQTSFLQKLFDIAKRAGVPVIVDPKGQDFSKYRGATSIKPNLAEARLAAGLTALDDVAQALFRETEVKALFITRSQEGISLFEQGQKRIDLPVRVRQVKDVTGAGDTVLAMLAVSLASGCSYEEAALLANVAAGIAVEQVGCACVGLQEVARGILEREEEIFSFEHLSALELVPFTTLEVDGRKPFSLDLFQEIRSRAQQKRGPLVLRVTGGSEEFLALLSSLKEVDFVVRDIPKS